MHGFNPHSFRHALALLAERKCRTPEEFKAWSQNLGHESVLTTFSSYGTLLEHRQADVIKSLKEPGARPTIQRRCCVVSPNWFKAPHCRTSLNFNQASYPHATVGRHSTLLQDLTSRLNVGPTQGRGRYFPSRAARGSTYRKATCGAASRLRCLSCRSRLPTRATRLLCGMCVGRRDWRQRKFAVVCALAAPTWPIPRPWSLID